MSDVQCCYCGQKLGWPSLDWDVFNVRHGMCCKPCFNRKAGVVSDDEHERMAKSAESLVELMEIAAGHKVYFAEPIQSCEEAKIMLQVNQSDDPAVWMVEEFGAHAYYGGDGRITVSIDGFLTYRCWDGNVTWDFENRVLKQPLTREDVRRLCELFGVEVKR